MDRDGLTVGLFILYRVEGILPQHFRFSTVRYVLIDDI